MTDQTLSQRQQLAAWRERHTDYDAPEYAYVGDAGTMWRWAIGLSLIIWSVIGCAVWLVVA
jgi:hypothetical protein